MTDQIPWNTSFDVVDQADAAIALHQVDRKTFRLSSAIRYVGEETGLEGRIDEEIIEQIRSIDPADLPTTDLASVPGPFRWFVARYGIHTPAALIHDRFIGADDMPAGLTDQDVDRYFRFMMADTGVRWLRRWIIWSAVAMRTRYSAGGVKMGSLILWVIAALLGTVFFAIGLATTNWAMVAGAALAPIPISSLWERQYGAGLVAAYSLPWIIPPSVLAVVAYGVYLGIEFIASLFLSKEAAGTDSFRYEGL